MTLAPVNIDPKTQPQEGGRPIYPWRWRVYERLPATLLARADQAGQFCKALSRRTLAINAYHAPLGEGGDSGRVVIVDDMPSVEYFVRRLFGRTVAAMPVGQVRLGDLPGALDDLANEADIVITRLHRGIGRWRLDGRYLQLPEAVESVIAVPGDGTMPERARRSHAKNLRKLRQNNLTWRVTHNADDFDHFFEKMYVPFAHQRFGDMAYVRSPHRLRRQFRRGGLMWICQGDDIIGGWVYASEKDCLHSYVLGTPDGDEEPINLGALAGTYAFGIELAHQLGKRYYHTGLSRPCLADGVLVHKKRWGAELRLRQPAYYDLYVRWDQPTPAVDRLLATSPLLARRGHGMAAVMGLDGDVTPKAIAARINDMVMPGVEQLCVMAPGAADINMEGVEIRHLNDAGVMLASSTSSAAIWSSARPL